MSLVRFGLTAIFNMIEKNELASESDVCLENVKLITDKSKLLKETTAQVQKEIKRCFEQLANTLKCREKQLLRQVDAIHKQQLCLVQSNSEPIASESSLTINLSAQHDIKELISNLGNLEVGGQDCVTVRNSEPYKLEEYQDTNKDHESFNKSLKLERDLVTTNNNGLSSSCNSSLQSDLENDTGSRQENCRLSIVNCTIINEKLSPKVLNNVPSECSAQITKADHEVYPDYKEQMVKSKSMCSNELIVQEAATKNSMKSQSDSSSGLKLQLDCIVHSDNRNEESNCRITDTKETPSNRNGCERTDLCIQANFDKDINSNKERNLPVIVTSTKEVLMNQNVRRESFEHPKQVQQWLQQILVETETEPMIHEIGQFSEISKARLSGQFPLET